MKPEAGDKRYLKKECTRRGWGCHVLVDTVRKKWPDRTLTAPGERIAFVEVKAEGASRNKAHVEAQKARLRELRELGFPAFFIVGKPGVDSLLKILENGYGWPGIREIEVIKGASCGPLTVSYNGPLTAPVPMLSENKAADKQRIIEALGLPGIEPV